MKPGDLAGRVTEILEMRADGHTFEGIATHMGCHITSIYAICTGNAYQNIEKVDRSGDKRDRRCCECHKVYTRYHTSGVPWKEYYRCAACAAGKWYREQMERFGRVLH